MSGGFTLMRNKLVTSFIVILFPFISDSQETLQLTVDSNNISTNIYAAKPSDSHFIVRDSSSTSDRNSLSSYPVVNRYSLKNFTGFTDSFKVVPNKKRVRLVTIANLVGYGGTMAGLYSAWYSNYPQSNFHFFDDNYEWKQVDKVGHGYSAYIESYGSMEMWKWTGMPRRKSAWLGSVSALAYQTIIETLDGFSEEWGWSWGDMGANVFGSGLLLGQELAWNEQRIKFKFSFHKNDYGNAELNNRADKLYGNAWQERMIKDYNGQTYWLSANLKSFFPKSNLPAWLSVAFGYGADGMFGAENNVGKDDHGSIVFDRRDISRHRQYYLSPDIDLTKIKTNSKFLKLALGFLNAFKFPAPSVEYNGQGKFAFHWLHF